MKSRSPSSSNRLAWLFPVALLLATGNAAAQRYLAADVIYVPAPMYGYAYPSPYATPCYPYCTALVVRNRTFERRQQRADALRADTPAPTEVYGPIHLTRPVGPRQGSDEELLPAYRSAGKVRPEYDGSGKYTEAYAELEISTAPAAEAGPGTTSAAPPVPQAPLPKRRAQPMLPCPKGAREC
jgi:hypothetical protein